MDFLGIGPGELLLILLIALLVLGPGKLPEMGRTLGRFMRQLRKVVSETAQDMSVELEESAAKPVTPDIKKDQSPRSPGPNEP